MPLYEYQCARCGRFEIIQKFSDPPLVACPTCGGEVQKVLSAPAIQFKGTGWYITDYARKSTGKDASKGEGKTEGAAAGAKDGGGSASKDGGTSSAGSTSKGESGTAATSTGTSKGSGGGSKS